MATSSFALSANNNNNMYDNKTSVDEGTYVANEGIAILHGECSEIANATPPYHDDQENAMVSLRHSYSSAADENKHIVNISQVSVSTVKLLEKALEQGLGFTVHGAGLKDILGNRVKSASFFVSSPRSESPHGNRKRLDTKNIMEKSEVEDQAYTMQNIDVHVNRDAKTKNSVKLLDQDVELQSDIQIQQESASPDDMIYRTAETVPSRHVILHQNKEPSSHVFLHETTEPSSHIILQENTASSGHVEPSRHVILQENKESSRSVILQEATNSVVNLPQTHPGTTKISMSGFMCAAADTGMHEHTTVIGPYTTNQGALKSKKQQEIHPFSSEIGYNHQTKLHSTQMERVSANLHNQNSSNRVDVPVTHPAGLVLEPARLLSLPNTVMEVTASRKPKERSLQKRHPPLAPLNIMPPGHIRSHEESGLSMSSSFINSCEKPNVHDYKIPEGSLPERNPPVEPRRMVPQVPATNSALDAVGGVLDAAIQQLQGAPDFNSKHYKPRSSRTGIVDHQLDDASVASQPTEQGYSSNWSGMMSARDRNNEYGHPYHDYMGSGNWNMPEIAEDKGVPRPSHIQGSHYSPNPPSWSYPEHHFYPTDQHSHYPHRWPQHPHMRHPGYYKEPPQWTRPNSQCSSPLQQPETCLKGHPSHVPCQCNPLLHSCPSFPPHVPYPHPPMMHPEEKQMHSFDFAMYKEQLHNSAPYHLRPPYPYHPHAHYGQHYTEFFSNRPANFDRQSLKDKSRKLLWLSEEEAEIIRLIRLSQDLSRNSSSYGPSGQTSPISSGRAGPSAHSNDGRDASRPSSRISTSSLEEFSAKAPGNGTCSTLCKVPSGDEQCFPVNEEDTLKCKVSSEEEQHFPVNDEDTNCTIPSIEEQTFTVNDEDTQCTLSQGEENNFPVNDEQVSPAAEENKADEQDKFQRELVIQQIRAASCIQHYWHMYAERKAKELEEQKRFEATQFVTEIPPCHEVLLQMAVKAMRDGQLVIWYDSVLKAAKAIQCAWRETIKRRYAPDQLPGDIKGMYALTVRRHNRNGRTPPSYETFERLMARFRAVTDGARIRRRIGSRRLQIIIKEIKEIRLVVDDLSQEEAAGTSCPNLLPQLQSQLQQKMSQLVTALNGPQHTARVLLRRGPATPILVNGSKNGQQGTALADSEFATVGDVAHVSVRSSIEIPIRPKMKVRKPMKALKPSSPTGEEKDQPPAQLERSSLPPRSTRKLRRQNIKQQNEDPSESPDAAETQSSSYPKSQMMVVSTDDFEKKPDGGKEKPEKEKHASKPNGIQSRRRLSTESRKAEQAENSNEQKNNNDESDNDDTSNSNEVQKRPFLKRKSKAMPAQKLDWSQVKPMVSSRLEPELKTRLVKPKFKAGSALFRKKKNFSDVKSRLFSYEKNQSSAGEGPDIIQDAQLRNGGSINNGQRNQQSKHESATGIETTKKPSNAKKKGVKKPSVRYSQNDGDGKEEKPDVNEQTESQQNVPAAPQRKTNEKKSIKQTKVSDTEESQVPPVGRSHNDSEANNEHKTRNHSNRYDDVDDVSNELDPSIELASSNEVDLSKESPSNCEVNTSENNECPETKQTDQCTKTLPVELTSSELEKMYDDVIARKQGKTNRLANFFRPNKESIVPRLQVSSSIFAVPRHEMSKLHQILSKEGCAGRLQHNCLSFVSIRD